MFLTGCLLFGGLGTLSGVVEIWTITCIAVERHRAISTPLTKVQRLTSSQINCLIGIIWLAGISVSILPLCGINKYVAETYLLACEFDTWSVDPWDRAYIYFLIVTAWLVPVVIIVTCYVNVSIE